mmetsp:Transcript_9751/g.17793  ORF Transcript_9751/g.17793 Transcript_9751/m.17793 type:complete len:396 (-) Transcript_9751:241-1428(-)
MENNETEGERVVVGQNQKIEKRPIRSKGLNGMEKSFQSWFLGPTPSSPDLQHSESQPSSSVEKSDYKLGPVIGVGTFGEVRQAVRKADGRQVAVKIVDLSSFDDVESVQQMLENEIKIQKSLDHPNIARVIEIINDVPCKGIWCGECACSQLVVDSCDGKCKNCRHEAFVHSEYKETRNVLMVVQELASRGDLFSILEKKQNFPEPVARFFFSQLIAAVGHCHSRGVLHRDLKPENLVVDANLNLKLIDFGLAARTTTKGGMLHSGVGSQPYTAPEILYQGGNNRSYRGEPADIWSCGVILFVMLTGYHPFRRPLMIDTREYKKCKYFCAIMRGSRKAYRHIPIKAQELLAKIFVLDPEKRITIEGIKKEPWLAAESKLTSNETVASLLLSDAPS